MLKKHSNKIIYLLFMLTVLLYFVLSLFPLEFQTNTKDKIEQHDAYAKLYITSEKAFIIAKYDDAECQKGTKVRIRWKLFGWYRDTKPIERKLIAEDEVTGNQIVELSTSVNGIGSYDYYLLKCVNKIMSNGNYEDKLETTSRFSKVAPYNGIWERTGEVMTDRAILHTYLTEENVPLAHVKDGSEMRHLVSPMAGYARFRVYTDNGLRKMVKESPWRYIDDYIHVNGKWLRSHYNFRWTVTGLSPNTKYYYVVETKSSENGSIKKAANVNEFKTAPAPDESVGFNFAVVSCLDAKYSQDNGRGVRTFRSMLEYKPLNPPAFVIITGDTVYYDIYDYSPIVGFKGKKYLRRWHQWPGQYRFENLRNFFKRVPGYFMVDDHDYWTNNINHRHMDGWQIFRNANPTPGSSGTLGEDEEEYYGQYPDGRSRGSGIKNWRAIRWGKDIELFFEEGRHHRNNTQLIWGQEQKKWLEESIKRSTATFKLIIATTPLIGPASSGHLPEDKHASVRYQKETKDFLMNISAVKNVYIIAGDRHWKYHSVLNKNRQPVELHNFNEFGCGSATGYMHASTPKQISDTWSKFLYYDRVPSGGYMNVEIVPLTKNSAYIIFRLMDLKNKVLYKEMYIGKNKSPQESKLSASLPLLSTGL